MLFPSLLGEGEGKGEGRGKYLRGGGGEGVPVQTGEQVREELGVDLDVFGDELGVFGVQGEGGGGCFAGLDGAGQEVQGEDLHRGCEMCFVL